MGMFDYFRSSYDLGEVFTDTCCHTKDIDDFSSGSMAQYWLSPDGQLYLIDYSHTADFVELKEGDEGFFIENGSCVSSTFNGYLTESAAK